MENIEQNTTRKQRDFKKFCNSLSGDSLEIISMIFSYLPREIKCFSFSLGRGERSSKIKSWLGNYMNPRLETTKSSSAADKFSSGISEPLEAFWDLINITYLFLVFGDNKFYPGRNDSDIEKIASLRSKFPTSELKGLMIIGKKYPLLRYEYFDSGERRIGFAIYRNIDSLIESIEHAHGKLLYCSKDEERKLNLLIYPFIYKSYDEYIP